jgi:tetratricopeptide (TPR) repeat protein
MDEILNQLVKVRDLKVISRTSSMSFKNSDETLKNIATKLGVANVVEGSVRKAGNRVRISVKLIKASTEQQLWSESYERNLSDVFDIQTEISKNIAKELKAIISPEVLEELEQIPTSNQLAYDYYLKAVQTLHYGGLERAAELCSKAIEADPNFAAAYILRCESYGGWYFNRLSGWENTFEKAKADFDKAKELNVASMELKVTEGLLLHCSRRYKEAIDVFEKLKGDYPNYSEIYAKLALSQRRLGRWGEARMNHEKSISLDPGDMNNYWEIARFSEVTRDYSKGYEYAVKLGNESYKETFLFKLTGNPKVFTTDLRNRYILNREFDNLIAVIDTSKLVVIENNVSHNPKDLDFAYAYYLKGDRERVKQYANEAIRVLEKKLKESSNDDRLFSALSFAYGYAGRHSDAIFHAKKAIEMVPIQADAFLLGPAWEENLVLIYILCGQYDLAMDKIEWLLTIPGYISNTELKVNPWYDPLRSLPRFQKILNTEYQTKL